MKKGLAESLGIPTSGNVSPAKLAEFFCRAAEGFLRHAADHRALHITTDAFDYENSPVGQRFPRARRLVTTVHVVTNSLIIDELYFPYTDDVLEGDFAVSAVFSVYNRGKGNQSRPDSSIELYKDINLAGAEMRPFMRVPARQ